MIDKNLIENNYTVREIKCCETCLHHASAYDIWCEHSKISDITRFVYVEPLGKCDLYEVME